MSASQFIRTTAPDALKLHVARQAGSEPRQFTIENQHMQLENFDQEYVSFGGYFGLHNPEVFAAAPELLEALTCLLRQTANPDPLHPAWRESRAKAANAIAKATG
jgi:hypothetical protein